MLIFLLILGFDFAYLFKRGFGQTAVFSNFVLIFMLYLGGLFADMRTAMYVFLTAVILLTGFTAFKAVHTRDLAGVKTVLKNPAFYIYAVAGFTFGFVFLNYTTTANAIGDEMTHWALVVKNMVAYDNFGNFGNATTMFDRYVPATGIFMYAFQIFENGFRNGAIYSAMDLLIISLALPVVDMFGNKPTLKSVVCFAAVILECFLFNVELFHSVLVDVPIAMMAAGIFLAYFQDRKRADGFTIVNVGLGCFVLTLTKSSGLPLVLFAIIFIIIDMFTLGKARTKEFFADKRNFAFVLLPIVLIAFANLSWNWYVDYYGVGAGWNSSEMTLPNILQWLKNPNPYQSQVTSLFLKTFFLGNGYGVQIPEILGLLLTVGACVVLYFKTRHKAFAITQGVVTVVIAVGYAIYLMLLYLFSFAYAEGLGLASYCRYMSSVWLMLALIYIYRFIDMLAEMKTEKSILPATVSAKLKPLSYPLFAAALGVFTVATSVGGYMSCIKKVQSEDAQYAVWAQTLQTLSRGDSVYIVINDSDGAANHVVEYLSMRFMATPIQTSGYLEGGNYSEGRDVNIWWTGNPFSSGATFEDTVKEMSAYSHVYLHDVWDGFADKYGVLFEDAVEDDALYRIVYRAGDMKLARV